VASHRGHIVTKGHGQADGGASIAFWSEEAQALRARAARGSWSARPRFLDTSASGKGGTSTSTTTTTTTATTTSTATTTTATTTTRTTAAAARHGEAAGDSGNAALYAFAALTKATYSPRASGLGFREKLEDVCGRFCRQAGVRIYSGEVRPITLWDKGNPLALFAYAARLRAAGQGAKPALRAGGCLLAVRGTVFGSNEERNAENELEPVRGRRCEGCKVHHGYQSIWLRLQSSVKESLRSLGCKKTDPLYLTGHSMGGAVATVSMYHLKSEGYNVQPSYVFSSPIMGNAAFQVALDGLFNRSDAVTLVTTGRDSIPRKLPSRGGCNPGDVMDVYPQVHFPSSSASHREHCSGPGADGACGIRRYACRELCPMKSSSCNDHCDNPLAPGGNICNDKYSMPKANTGGEDEVSSDDQLEEVENGTKAKEHVSCVDGLQAPAQCAESFEFRGKTYRGCARADYPVANETGGWCSLDSAYRGNWSPCFPCESAGAAKGSGKDMEFKK